MNVECKADLSPNQLPKVKVNHSHVTFRGSFEKLGFKFKCAKCTITTTKEQPPMI
jgi:hypothetical protein